MTNKSDGRQAPRAPRATRAPAGKTQTAGAKLLLTAGALAATLGGWAVLTAAETQAPVPPVQSAPPAASQVLAQPSAEAVSLDLPPLPTLVPLATPHAITLTELARPAVAAPVVAQPVVVQPVAYVQPTAQPTVAPAAPAPRLVLRSVTAPPPNTDRGGGGGGGGGPAPATTSKSSRP